MSTWGNFASGNTDIVQKTSIDVAISIATSAKQKGTYPLNDTGCYPIPPNPISANTSSAALYSNQSFLNNRQCYVSNFYNNLARNKINQQPIRESAQITECIQNAIIANRFLKYQRIPPDIPPPLTVVEQMSITTGIPDAPPGQCINIIGIGNTIH